MFENLEGLSFQIPFKKNPSGLPMTCTFGHGESRKNGTIDIFQKTKSKQYSIPQVGIGDLFTIGSPFSYTKQTMESHQTELAITTEQDRQRAVDCSGGVLCGKQLSGHAACRCT
jgi:hypothetical protein